MRRNDTIGAISQGEAIDDSGSVPFAHVAINHSHSQQPVPRGFPLFKRYEWLVVNCNVGKRAPMILRSHCRPSSLWHIQKRRERNAIPNCKLQSTI